MLTSEGKTLQSIRDYKIHIGIMLILSSTTVYLALTYESSHTEGLKIGLLLTPEDNVDLLRGILDELTGISSEPFVAFHRNYDSLLENFKSSKKVGVNHFITSANRNELQQLCESTEVSSAASHIWSFHCPPPNCLGKIKMMDAPFEAHLMALVDRLFQAKLQKVIVILEERHSPQNQFILNTFLKYNIEILLSSSINDDTFLREKQLEEYLTKHRHVPLLTISGESLSTTIRFLQNTNLLKSRMILSYIDPGNAVRIIRDDREKHEAEKLMLYTTSSRNLHKMDAIISRYNYDVTKFEEYAIARKAVSYFKDNLNCYKHPRDVINNSFLEQKFVIELLRFVPDFLRSYLIQDHPFFLEQVVHLSYLKDKNAWNILKVEHSVFKIFSKDELIEISKGEDCEPTRINVTATENYRIERVTSSYDIATVPAVLLIPNSNPEGFIIKIQCKSAGENEVLEIGCLGTYFANKSVECLTAKSYAHRRRIIRSYTSNHIIPIDKKENVDNSYAMMNMMKVNRMSSIIPQIAGCVGASGGCSLCFIYLQFIVPNGSPGVCYGACAVGIGGACTSFVAIGLQRSTDFTVICSELFNQGRIDIISYMADARFGSILSTKNPMALKGYQIAASPLAYLMRKSPYLSEIVNQFAIPWIHHMEHVVHLKKTDNFIGHILTVVGIPVFSFLGFCFANAEILLPLLVTFLIFKNKNRMRIS